MKNRRGWPRLAFAVVAAISMLSLALIGLTVSTAPAHAEAWGCHVSNYRSDSVKVRDNQYNIVGSIAPGETIEAQCRQPVVGRSYSCFGHNDNRWSEVLKRRSDGVWIYSGFVAWACITGPY